MTQAGPEISVASTKAYTAQVTVLTLLALYIAQLQEMPGVRVEELVQELQRMSELAEKALKLEDQIKVIAEKLPLVLPPQDGVLLKDRFRRALRGNH